LVVDLVKGESHNRPQPMTPSESTHWRSWVQTTGREKIITLLGGQRERRLTSVELQRRSGGGLTK
jgi:hypothetical protein